MIILTFTIIYNLYLIVGLRLAVKSKEKGYYHLQFINIIIGIIIAITNVVYPIGVNTLPGNTKLHILTIGLITDILLLITSIATLIAYNTQKKNKKLKYTKKFYLKRIFKFAITVLLVIYSSQSIVFLLQEGRENKVIDKEKDTQQEEAIKYIKSKYNITLEKDNCIYYSKEKYILDEKTNTKIYSPYIMIYKYNNETMTIMKKKNILSDNRQIPELNKIISEYFSKKSNLEIDFADIDKVYDEAKCENESVVSTVIQNGYNIKINSNNIPDFMGEVLKEKNLRIELYIKENGNRNIQSNDIKKRIAYLQEYENIKEIDVYIYSNQLKIKKEEYHYKAANNNKNKFECYYAPAEENNISYKIVMKKENNKDWIIEN